MASKDEVEKRLNMQATVDEDKKVAVSGKEGGQAIASTSERISTASTDLEAQDVDILGTGENAPDSQAPVTTETHLPGQDAFVTASPPPQYPPRAPFPRTHPLIPTIGHFGTAPQDPGIPFDRATALRLERQRCESYIMTLQQLMRLWERGGREGRLRRLANELEVILEKNNGLPLRDGDEE